MKIEDLRIGNVLTSEGKLVKVLGVTILNRVYYGSIDSPCYNYIIDFKPIKLTPEILIQVGFELDLIGWRKDKCLLKSVSDSEFVIGRLSIGLLGTKVEYLHQLQNIYYFMNNWRELQIDINTLSI